MFERIQIKKKLFETHQPQPQGNTTVQQKITISIRGLVIKKFCRVSGVKKYDKKMPSGEINGC